MAKRLSSKELAKLLQSTTPKVAIISSRSSSRVCFSNARAHTPGGDPVVGAAETRGDGIANPGIDVDHRTRKEGEEQSSVTGFVAGAAKLGTTKATEVLESVGDAAKETVDSAWDAAKKTAQRVGETTMAEADTSVVDTVEYISAAGRWL